MVRQILLGIPRAKQNTRKILPKYRRTNLGLFLMVFLLKVEGRRWPPPPLSSAFSIKYQQKESHTSLGNILRSICLVFCPAWGIPGSISWNILENMFVVPPKR